MRHVPTNLYIDTQAIVGNSLVLDTGDFKELKDTFVKDGLRLLVPEMMERELFRKYEESAKKAAKRVKEAHKIYPINTLPLGDLPSRDELEKQCLSELKRQWEAFKEHFVVEELPLVGNLEDVVNWYFEIKVPFASSSGKQKEFPDAFIISALEHYHQENQASIAVVTKDGSVKEACISRPYIAHYPELGDYIEAFNPDRTAADLNPEPTDLTQPIVTEDLTVLKEILGRGGNVTPIEIDRVLNLLRSRGENYQYFFLDAVILYGLAISNKMVTSKNLLSLWSRLMILFNILSGRSLNISRMYLKMFRKKFFGSCWGSLRSITQESITIFWISHYHSMANDPRDSSQRCLNTLSLSISF